jgi:Mn-dependent DtxR family transcriptional regulator
VLTNTLKMDDLLGLNEIELNNNSNSYFEEEDKKEELYIKMIEDRIIFKIRKEIIEPLISDFNFKIDINTREISKLNQDKLELKEYLDKEKIKNIELTEEINRLNKNSVIKNEKNTREISRLNEKMDAYLKNIQNYIDNKETQINNLSNIISKLNVCAPSVSNPWVNQTDFKNITTEQLFFMGPPSHNRIDIKMFYNLKILHLKDVKYVDFQYIHNDYLETLIIELNNKNEELHIYNINCLPSLRVIEFKQIYNINVDELIKNLSLYEHKIQNFIFTDCKFVRNRFSVNKFSLENMFNKLQSYCDENNIKLEF